MTICDVLVAAEWVSEVLAARRRRFMRTAASTTMVINALPPTTTMTMIAVVPSEADPLLGELVGVIAELVALNEVCCRKTARAHIMAPAGNTVRGSNRQTGKRNGYVRRVKRSTRSDSNPARRESTCAQSKPGRQVSMSPASVSEGRGDVVMRGVPVSMLASRTTR